MIKRDTLKVGILKQIQSFVAREGRMTDAQRMILDEMWSQFGLPLQNKKLDLKHIFGRVAPLTVEIGFGDGRALLAMAIENPQQDFIGIEVYRTGIAKLFVGIRKNNLSNIRVFCADALEVLSNCIPDASVQQLQLFFPDPWPKARHHKRRIVQADFASLVWRKLVNTGTLHMATDWENYAQHMLALMEQQSGWENSAGLHNFALRPTTRPLTKFESRGHRLGYGTWDLIFRKYSNI